MKNRSRRVLTFDKRVNFKCMNETFEKVRKYAIAEDKDVSDILRDLMERYIRSKEEAQLPGLEDER
jgi:hypothetical protein